MEKIVLWESAWLLWLHFDSQDPSSFSLEWLLFLISNYSMVSIKIYKNHSREQLLWSCASTSAHSFLFLYPFYLLIICPLTSMLIWGQKIGKLVLLSSRIRLLNHYMWRGRALWILRTHSILSHLTTVSVTILRSHVHIHWSLSAIHWSPNTRT